MGGKQAKLVFRGFPNLRPAELAGDMFEDIAGQSLFVSTAFGEVEGDIKEVLGCQRAVFAQLLGHWKRRAQQLAQAIECRIMPADHGGERASVRLELCD